MSHPSPNDRRISNRVPLKIGVCERRIGRSALCQAENISNTGILIAKVFDRLYRPACRSWLEFSLPGSDRVLAVRSRVERQFRRDRYHLLAFSFQTIAPSHRRQIGEYISRTIARRKAQNLAPEQPLLIPVWTAC